VKDLHRRVVALAATLVPGRAASLLGRHLGIDPGDARQQISSGRADRLRALAEALRTVPGGARGVPESGSGENTLVRGTDPPRQAEYTGNEDPPPAWRVLSAGRVLPFEMRTVSPALAEVNEALRALGERAARSAAAGLASVLGGEAVIRGRVLPGVPEPGASALVPVELTALAGQATLAVDCGFAARLAERVAGAAGRRPVATFLTSVERAVVELAVLGALDGIAAETDIEAALAPRLGLRGGTPVRPLCVELSITAADTQGRALLFLPQEALRALSRMVELPEPLGAVAVAASLRSGSAALAASEVAALRPGDVVILDASPGDAASLLLPGGLRALGRLEGDSLEVREVDVADSDLGQDDLPVVLDVELASVPVPLRDIARIAPGAVLLLGLDRDGQVTLRIGGRAVARGELVDVDGAVGVRVLAMEPSP
jgi:type III secretion protein Q